MAGVAFIYARRLLRKSSFEEYKLDNGLHVILHNDPSAPTVITSVMYHVVQRDETQRTLVLLTF
jgi:predicted Zn-dependent peptidase